MQHRYVVAKYVKHNKYSPSPRPKLGELRLVGKEKEKVLLNNLLLNSYFENITVKLHILYDLKMHATVELHVLYVLHTH